jgi:hypothetical protein
MTGFHRGVLRQIARRPTPLVPLRCRMSSQQGQGLLEVAPSRSPSYS